MDSEIVQGINPNQISEAKFYITPHMLLLHISFLYYNCYYNTTSPKDELFMRQASQSETRSKSAALQSGSNERSLERSGEQNPRPGLCALVRSQGSPGGGGPGPARLLNHSSRSHAPASMLDPASGSTSWNGSLA